MPPSAWVNVPAPESPTAVADWDSIATASLRPRRAPGVLHVLDSGRSARAELSAYMSGSASTYRFPPLFALPAGADWGVSIWVSLRISVDAQVPGLAQQAPECPSRSPVPASPTAPAARDRAARARGHQDRARRRRAVGSDQRRARRRGGQARQCDVCSCSSASDGTRCQGRHTRPPSNASVSRPAAQREPPRAAARTIDDRRRLLGRPARSLSLDVPQPARVGNAGSFSETPIAMLIVRPHDCPSCARPRCLASRMCAAACRSAR
jgi:hypothetical protein